MEPQLVQIQTEDLLTLPGLLYTSPSAKKVAIYLHGNGSSSVFYHDDLRTEFAEEFLKNDIAFLAFNNRGADYMKKLHYVDEVKESRRFGMAYEVIKDCVLDIDASIAFLRQRGFETFYLVGESTGANKICVYDHYKKENPTSGYMVLSGGDDVGIYYESLGHERFWQLLAESQQKIAEGKGDDLVMSLLPSPIFSYNSFFDIANPDGDYNVFPFFEALNAVQLSKKQPLFSMYSALKKPTITVYGSDDQFCWGQVPRIVEILKQSNPKPTYKIIEGGDHVFTHHRREVGQALAEWLSSTKTQTISIP
jgi:pimeloyl-ACP methyl ester carboxylesterase